MQGRADYPRRVGAKHGAPEVSLRPIRSHRRVRRSPLNRCLLRAQVGRTNLGHPALLAPGIAGKFNKWTALTESLAAEMPLASPSRGNARISTVVRYHGPQTLGQSLTPMNDIGKEFVIPTFHPWRPFLRLARVAILSAFFALALWSIGYATRNLLDYDSLRLLFVGAAVAFFVTGLTALSAVIAAMYGSCQTCPCCQRPFSRDGLLHVPLRWRCIHCGYKIGSPNPVGGSIERADDPLRTAGRD
jgi:hypothetical protein